MGVVFGIADALFFPAMNADRPRRSSTPERLPAANGLVQSTAQPTTLVGPVVAGLLVVAVGTGAAFAVDAVSFAIAALAVLAMRGAHTLPAVPRRPPRRPRPTPRNRRQARAAHRHQGAAPATPPPTRPSGPCSS